MLDGMRYAIESGEPNRSKIAVLNDTRSLLVKPVSLVRLAAGFIAADEDRLDDALYVRELAYTLYEEGAFRDQAAGKPVPCPNAVAAQPASLHALDA